MGIATGDVVVSSMMDDAGYLAPLDETDDNTRRDESDDDDAAPHAAARRSRRRNRRARRGTNSANYTHEPRMYLVTRGRVDILAPGPGPIESNDDAMNKDANDDTGKKREKKKKQKGTREGKEWHRAVGLGPGSCFSAPLQAIHGFDVPGGCKAVAGTGDLRLITVPMSIVQRNGAVAVMEECRISTMQMAESTPWLAWVEPRWVRGFVIDSFVIERRGDERDVYTVGGDGTMGGIRRLGLDVPFVRRGGAVDAMRVVTEGAVTGAGGGGVVTAGGVFHESALDLDVVDLDAATSPHVASNDAIARVSPTECIAMHRDALRHHVTHSVYVKHSLASNAEAEALRVRLRRRLDTIRSDDVDTGRGHRSDADPEVITDEHLIAMGIMKTHTVDGSIHGGPTLSQSGGRAAANRTRPRRRGVRRVVARFAPRCSHRCRSRARRTRRWTRRSRRSASSRSCAVTSSRRRAASAGACASSSGGNFTRIEDVTIHTSITRPLGGTTNASAYSVAGTSRGRYRSCSTPRTTPRWSPRVRREDLRVCGDLAERRVSASRDIATNGGGLKKTRGSYRSSVRNRCSPRWNECGWSTRRTRLTAYVAG